MTTTTRSRVISLLFVAGQQKALNEHSHLFHCLHFSIRLASWRSMRSSETNLYIYINKNLLSHHPQTLTPSHNLMMTTTSRAALSCQNRRPTERPLKSKPASRATRHARSLRWRANCRQQRQLAAAVAPLAPMVRMRNARERHTQPHHNNLDTGGSTISFNWAPSLLSQLIYLYVTHKHT